MDTPPLHPSTRGWASDTADLMGTLPLDFGIRITKENSVFPWVVETDDILLGADATLIPKCGQTREEASQQREKTTMPSK